MSKFDKIFEARETDAEEARNGDDKQPSQPKPISRKKDSPNVTKTKTVAAADIPSAAQMKPKRGRPTAKRSDPDFVGLTTYIRRDTHTRAKIALLQEGNGRELSELVEDLMQSWLSNS